MTVNDLCPRCQPDGLAECMTEVPEDCAAQQAWHDRWDRLTPAERADELQAMDDYTSGEVDVLADDDPDRALVLRLAREGKGLRQ